MPTRLKTKGKFISEADFSGVDTINSVVHFGYCRNRIKSGFELLYLPSVTEKLGNYDTYLQKTVGKLNDLQDRGEPIIHFLDLDYWKYSKPAISIPENNYLVFTRSGSPNFYLPEAESFFDFLRRAGIKKTRIMGEVASSPKIYIQERNEHLKFVPSEDHDDAGCLRSVCDMFLACGFEVEPLVDLSYPSKWDKSKGRNAYYEKKLLSGWHDTSETTKWSDDIMKYEYL